MPTPTYIPMATVTLGSSASSVTFSSIPATYRDLVLVSVPVHASSSTSGSGFGRFNADSGSNYPFVFMGTDLTATPIVGSGTLTAFVTSRFDDRQDGMGVCQILDYSATDKHKTVLTRAGMGNRTAAGVTSLAWTSRWANTAAITSITLTTEVAGSYATGSRFDLYGIKA